MKLKPSTERALDRVFDKMARPPKKRKRFSIAPVYLALALVLGYQLLVRFLPMLWSQMLPGGLAQANSFWGWPGLVWRLAVLFNTRFDVTLLWLGGIGVSGFLISSWLRPLRFLVWLAALLMIAFDAGIIIVALKTAMDLTMRQAGIN